MTAIGLLYDIFGVGILGWALAVASDRAIKTQAGTYYTFSPPFLRALVAQRTDAQFGLFLLILGFIFQFLGAVKVYLGEYGERALFMGLIIFLVIYFVFRTTIIERESKRLLGELKKAAKKRNKPDRNVTTNNTATR